ncbi:gluconate kinase (FGGY family) [Tepidibacillus fermentans]|uniref:Gluconate kinase (FGGY family) n=1 Tax=Tepidibacillus fermentans TaxID=1281767 RepID=A0A4V2URZ0_9BACI|nr:gluconate kinase (FGGY family) [Tepidibacillus fermentans]
MEQRYVMGLDIGTTSTKATIFTLEGHLISSESIEYPIFHPKADWAEQDPDVIYQAVLDTIRGSILKGKIKSSELIGIGISSAMHSLIAIDQYGNPLTNSIIWADNRSVDYVKQLKEEWNGHEIYLRTGTPIHPMSPLSKLIWMREEQPALFKKAAKWISIKEYIMWKWFSEYVVDYSIASTTGLFHLKSLDWDQEVLNLIGITKDQLSIPVPTTTIYQGMNTEAANYMGIPKDLPIIIGASDGVLANLGVGAIEPGELAVTIGTSGAIRTVVDKPITDKKERTFCYALIDNHWVIGGPINNGGIALRWFRDQFAAKEVKEAIELGKNAYDLMIEEADKVPAGANGLIFLPYLSGERAPYWDANTRGVFFGISLIHKREHFIRAVLEGIAFAVYSVGEALIERSICNDCQLSTKNGVMPNAKERKTNTSFGKNSVSIIVFVSKRKRNSRFYRQSPKRNYPYVDHRICGSNSCG